MVNHSPLSDGVVTEFKVRYCDENHLIARLLRDRFRSFVRGPILDVGCGLGDLCAIAFPDVEAILLDRLPFCECQPVSPLHHRIQMDFFDYLLDERRSVGTLLLSHVLQYLDEDLEGLQQHVRHFKAQRLITVTNTNEGFMGDLLAWADVEMPSCNPERLLPCFPEGYRKERVEYFDATLACPDFAILSTQVAFILDVPRTPDALDAIKRFIGRKLASPAFTIRQAISAYTIL